ncbi:MAG: flagellar filament capping protein FliD [Treponemataceae bacterium]
MADISIPGVSDKYKTNDLVKSLVEVEKIPLKREQEKLDGFKTEQANWRRVNQYMSALRESSRVLYSFDNPFNEKTASSSDDFAVTATAQRDASVDSFKIDVIQTAACDRFLSEPIEKNRIIPEGTYKFTIGEKTVTYRWKGGKLSDFSEGLNKRSSGLLKSSLIGVTKDSTSLLIESLKSGSENKLIFEGDSLKLAYELKIIQDKKSQENIFAKNDIINPASSKEIQIPKELYDSSDSLVSFSVHVKNVEDINKKIANEILSSENGNKNDNNNLPKMPFAGSITFKDITIENEDSKTLLQPVEILREKIEISTPVRENKIISLKYTDGSIKELEAFDDDFSDKEYAVNLDQNKIIKSIVIDNKNTDKIIEISQIKKTDRNNNLGYEPVSPISVAQNAKIKYEGILMERPSNEIDDIVPGVNLELHSITDRSATIKIENNTETSKDALINFVGNYNRLIAELNILTQLEPKIIDELDYLSEDEREKAMERMGAFQTDFSLRNNKTSLQQIMSSNYPTSEESKIKTLAQIGISTKSSKNTSISSSQMRGYLEIDEKKLDEALKQEISSIKNIFGFDSDGDKIVDSGIAYQIDRKLQSYVQTGGILALKNSAIEKEISDSEKKIKRLEVQIADKEADLKRKYGTMESTLKRLESQSDSITNFSNQNGKK